jgi:hypothetical protein
METGKEIPTIELRRNIHLARCDGAFERVRIASDGVRGDSDFAGATVDDDSVSERAAEKMDSRLQCDARSFIIGVRPEEREEHIAPVDARQRRGTALRQIDEQRESSGLRKHCGDW